MDLQLIISIILIILFFSIFMSISFEITMTDNNGVTRQISLSSSYDKVVDWFKTTFGLYTS